MAQNQTGPGAPLAFNAAFERLRASVTIDDARSFTSTTLEDVRKAAKDIEAELERRQAARGLVRLKALFSGLEQYSDVVGILCNGTPYLPWIWAPIKLMLQISKEHTASFEKLIEAYGLIGDCMPRFDKYQVAFKDSPDFQQALANIYVDITEFHRRAYKFFRRRAWHIIFESAWKTFDSRFHYILESLRKHRDLVDAEANAINITEASQFRKAQLEEITKWRREFEQYLQQQDAHRLNSQVTEVTNWLGNNDLQEDLLGKLTSLSEGSRSEWVLQKPTIKKWLDKTGDCPFLWLNGKPGKSVICAELVKYIQQNSEPSRVLIHFNDPGKVYDRPLNDILRSLAAQVLELNKDVAPYIVENFVYLGQRPTNKNLQFILGQTLQTIPSIRLVLDGLDELNEESHAEVTVALQKLQRSSAGACKVIISSRKLPHLTRLFKTWISIPLEDDSYQIKQTISIFVKSRLGNLRNTFGDQLADKTESKIIENARGMFLWVRLVLSVLDDLYREKDIEEAVDSIPEGLPAMYRKILTRICETGPAAKRKCTIKILQWLLVARRPLKRYEIESGIAFDENNVYLDESNKVRGDVLSLCSPLLDVMEGPYGNVSLIHFTVKEYLFTLHENSSFAQPRADFSLALSCIIYLCISLVLISPDISARAQEGVLRGEHDLHFYANDYWFEHLRASNTLSASKLTELEMSCLRHALLRLAIAQEDIDIAQASLPKESVSVMNQTHVCPEGWALDPLAVQLLAWVERSQGPATEKLQRNQISDSGQGTSLVENNKQQNSASLFSRLRSRYQEIFEACLIGHADALQCESALLAAFKSNHSPSSFFCQQSSCPRSWQGFATWKERDDHEREHAPKFCCTEAYCPSYAVPFASRAQLKKHRDKYHTLDTTSIVPSNLSGHRAKLPLDFMEPVPPYACPLCQERFHRKADQRSHLHDHAKDNTQHQVTESQFTKQEQLQISQLAEALYKKAVEDDTIHFAYESVTKMAAEKRAQLRNAGQEPIMVHYRRQAALMLRQRNSAEAQGKQFKAQGLPDSQPQNQALTPQNNGSGIANGVICNPNTDTTQLTGLHEQVILSEAIGDDVVPGSNKPALGSAHQGERRNDSANTYQSQQGSLQCPNPPVTAQSASEATINAATRQRLEQLQLQLQREQQWWQQHQLRLEKLLELLLLEQLQEGHWQLQQERLKEVQEELKEMQEELLLLQEALKEQEMQEELLLLQEAVKKQEKQLPAAALAAVAAAAARGIKTR